ncbi:MAG: DUF7343 domain-containing protein [Nitrososphaerales archaeon]
MGKVERSILEILRINGGEAYQTSIVELSGFSRSRVSEIVSKLERNGLVSRFPLGKNFKVVLGASRGNNESRVRITLGFTRSAEYDFLPVFSKIARQNLGKKIEYRIYENGIEVVRDLASQRIDLGIAPLLTLFESFSLGSPFRIIAPAGAGGSSLIERRYKSEKKEDLHVATTKLSTMELFVRTSMKQGILTPNSSVRYASSSSEIIRELFSRRVDVASIWEPYATMIMSKNGEKFARIARYAEMSEHICCALAAGNHIEERLVRRIAKSFIESVNIFETTPEQAFAAYSALTGFDQGMLRKVSQEYNHPLELDTKLIADQFQRAGITVPLPSTVQDAIKQVE